MIGHVEEVMGTVVSFSVDPGRCSEPEAREAIGRACESLHEADSVFSTWIHDSPVNRLRRGELGPEECPPVVGAVLALCAAARDATGGWFDPWAIPGGVDPTGLVKGWAVERALRTVGTAGVAAAMVNGGGDIATTGHPPGGGPWRVGIRHPWRADALACILGVDGCVATSGGYERGQHLIDPATGRPVTRTASATVTGPSLALADAYATALAVGGDDAFDVIATGGDYDAYLIRLDGSERMSDGIVVLS